MHPPPLHVRIGCVPTSRFQVFCFLLRPHLVLLLFREIRPAQVEFFGPKYHEWASTRSSGIPFLDAALYEPRAVAARHAAKSRG